MSNKLSQRPLSNTELSMFCEQLSMTLKAGISVADGIGILLEEAQNDSEKELFSFLLEHLENFESLHDSLKASGAFPDYMLNMITIGEETGTLDEVTDALSFHYEREESVRQYIKNAITYPLVMTAMMITVIVVLLVKVMPVFNQVYIQLGSELSGISAFLLNLGSAISSFSLPVIIIAAAVILFLIFLSTSEKGKALKLDLAYKTGIGRQLYEDTAAMRFSSGMALVLRTGLDADRGLELTASLSDNDPFFKKKLEHLREMMQNGNGFSNAVFDSGIFSGSYARMLSVGSKSGSADVMMARISDMYREKVDTRLGSRIAKIEPALVIAMSVIVGCILLSVMLPLMGILSGI